MKPADLHALIDNFSRRILAWKISPTFAPEATAEILLAAAGNRPRHANRAGRRGVENYNGLWMDSSIRAAPSPSGRHRNHVFQFHDRSWWHVLKHQWLFLNSLDTVIAVRNLVAFYVQDTIHDCPLGVPWTTPDECT